MPESGTEGHSRGGTGAETLVTCRRTSRRTWGILAGMADSLTAAALGVDRLGERATLVQFSSAFCRPCVATRRILGEVAAMVDGVARVDVDAESRLELVRRLGITGTPTVLVLDAAGRIVRRAVGQPRTADVIGALGDVVR